MTGQEMLEKTTVLVWPCAMHSWLQQSAFCVAGPTAWNSLPSDIELHQLSLLSKSVL